jgi:hypothetical protein
MSRVEGEELMVSGGLLYYDMKFDPAPNTCPSSLFVRQQNQIVKLDTNLEEMHRGGLEFTG